MNWKLRLLLILAVLVLIGCEEPAKAIGGGEANMVPIYQCAGCVSPSIYRFVDKEADVVCWAMVAGQRGGISCLPLTETTLDE